MLEFDYQALNAEGQSITGRIAARSAALATAELERQGLTVQSLQQVEIAEPVQAIVTPVSQDACEQVLVERVGQLVQQRELLAPALAAFAAELPAGCPRRELRKLASLLSDGASAEQIVRDSSLSTLLPLLGNDLLLGSHHSLGDLFAESARKNSMRTARLRSIAYPLFVLAVAFAVLLFLSFTVIPTIGAILDDFDLDVPGLTKVVIGVSNELRFHSLRLLAMIIGVIAIAVLLIRLLKLWGLPGRVLGVFTTGNSSQVSALSNFARTLAETLGSGMSLSCAFRLAGKSTNLAWLQREANSLAMASEGKWCLSESDARQTRLPAMVSYALRAGPSGAPCLALLRELAELYAERVRNRLDLRSGFVTHFMILFVGFIVATVVFALFIPLVELVNGLTG